MNNIPNKPIDQYPQVPAHELPPVPPRAPADEPDPPPQQASRPGKAQPVATLDFVGERERSVPLIWPFVWDGQRVDVITVRRLITTQVANLTAGGSLPDIFDAYAAMTGFPAEVLRGLDGEDGVAVAEAAYDFLPRTWQAVYSGST